jgi:hypothetical protein
MTYIKEQYDIRAEVEYKNICDKTRITRLFINDKVVHVHSFPMDICVWTEEDFQIKQRIGLIQALLEDLKTNYNYQHEFK